MTSTFRKAHPQATFLSLALLVSVIASAAGHRYPKVAFAACLDMTLTVTAIYYWLLVRPGLRPKMGLLCIFLMGLLRASFAFPAVVPGRFWIGAALEIFLVAAVIGGFLPFPAVEKAIRGELSVFYYAFTWAKPDIPAGTTPFTLYKKEGYQDLVLMIGMASLLELLPMHLLVAHWSTKAAWILSGFSLYGAVWAVALYRSFGLRPGLVGNGELVIRFGLMFSLRVPLDSILTIQTQPIAGAVIMPRRATPSLYLEFRQPLEAQKMLGFTKKISAIGIAPDDVSMMEAYIDHLPR